MTTQATPEEVRKRVAERYPDDADIKQLLRSQKAAEKLLERALWEFGSELRVEIEAYFGTK